MGVDGDVTHRHHLVMLLRTVFEHLQDALRILAVTSAPVAPRLGDAMRGLEQTFAGRIVANVLEQTADVVFDAGLGVAFPREHDPAALELFVRLLVDEHEEGLAWELVTPVFHRAAAVDQVIDEQIGLGRVFD